MEFKMNKFGFIEVLFAYLMKNMKYLPTTVKSKF